MKKNKSNKNHFPGVKHLVKCMKIPNCKLRVLIFYIKGLGVGDCGAGEVRRELGIIRCSWNNLLFFLNLPRSPRPAQSR